MSSVSEKNIIFVSICHVFHFSRCSISTSRHSFSMGSPSPRVSPCSEFCSHWGWLLSLPQWVRSDRICLQTFQSSDVFTARSMLSWQFPERFHFHVSISFEKLTLAGLFEATVTSRIAISCVIPYCVSILVVQPSVASACKSVNSFELYRLF